MNTVMFGISRTLIRKSRLELSQARMLSQLKEIQCRAAVLYREGKMEIEDVLIEPPGENQIRVKMVATGVCSSDGYYLWGEEKFKQSRLVLGHEGSAVVESVGPNVSKVKPGDHVLLSCLAECGQCSSCENPLSNLCLPGSTLEQQPNKRLLNGSPVYGVGGSGLFSEFVLLNQSLVVKIDKKVDLIPASVISCAVSTGFYSAVNLANVTPDSTCAIWGLGAVGLNVVFGCHYREAENIIGIDPNNDKRRIALEFGCTEFVNPTELNKPIDQYLREKYNGLDFGFDCFGSEMIIESALRSLNPWGTFVLVGVPPPGARIEYPARQLVLGRKLVGGILGGMKINSAYTELSEMFLRGEYPLDLLITNRFKFEQIEEAFQTLKEGKCIRSVITFE